MGESGPVRQEQQAPPDNPCVGVALYLTQFRQGLTYVAWVLAQAMRAPMETAALGAASATPRGRGLNPGVVPRGGRKW